MDEAVISIGAFLMIFGIIWTIGFYGQRKRQAIHETLRLAMEKGQDLSPQMIKDMSLITNPRVTDLRRAVVLIALAVAFVLIGLVNLLFGDGDAEELLAVAVFPGMIGLAFLVLWKYGYDRSAD